MIRIKVFKASQLLYGAAVVVLCVIIVALGISYFVGKAPASPPASPSPTAAQPRTLPPIATATPQETEDLAGDSDFLADAAHASALLGGTKANSEQLGAAVSLVSSGLLGVDLLDPISMLCYQFPALAKEEEAALPVTADAGADEPDDFERVKVQVKGRYIAQDKPKYRVLIYHTHSYEAYEQVQGASYVETSKWRSADSAFNIIRVGDELTRRLRAMGVEVVHDKTEHEPPKLGTAYERSLKTLENYAQQGEEFDLLIDLHRDAASSRNTNPSTTLVDGKECARLMMLIGNGENGFSVMPQWEENFKLAQALTDSLNGMAQGLCRDVMVKGGRYNQHMSTKAVLIEVGHNENTLDQAVNATGPLAKAIVSVLTGTKSQASGETAVK